MFAGGCRRQKVRQVVARQRSAVSTDSRVLQLAYARPPPLGRAPHVRWRRATQSHLGPRARLPGKRSRGRKHPGRGTPHGHSRDVAVNRGHFLSGGILHRAEPDTRDPLLRLYNISNCLIAQLLRKSQHATQQLQMLPRLHPKRRFRLPPGRRGPSALVKQAPGHD